MRKTLERIHLWFSRQKKCSFLPRQDEEAEKKRWDFFPYKARGEVVLRTSSRHSGEGQKRGHLNSTVASSPTAIRQAGRGAPGRSASAPLAGGPHVCSERMSRRPLMDSEPSQPRGAQAEHQGKEKPTQPGLAPRETRAKHRAFLHLPLSHHLSHPGEEERSSLGQ